jgi:hypothetical protein
VRKTGARNGCVFTDPQGYMRPHRSRAGQETHYLSVKSIELYGTLRISRFGFGY